VQDEAGKRGKRQADRAGEAERGDALHRDISGVADVAATKELRIGIDQFAAAVRLQDADAVILTHDRREIADGEEVVGIAGPPLGSRWPARIAWAAATRPI
jgi:hypothetical protein